MNILLILYWLKMGGGETQAYYLAKYLINKGHNVFIFSSRGPLLNEFLNLGVTFIEKQKSYLKNIILLHRLLNDNNIRIIHANHYEHEMLLLPFIFTHKCFLSIHGATPHKNHNRLLKIIIKNNIKQIISSSKSVKDFVINYYNVEGEKISIIPNSIESDLFCDNRVKKHKILNITMTCRIDKDKRKSMRTLINSSFEFEKLKMNYNYNIIGDGEVFEVIKNEIIDINKKLKYGKINLLGQKSQDEIMKLLHKIDIFVGVGRAALEAMSCGLPVIICGNYNCKNGSYSGIVDENNISEIANYNFSARNSYISNDPKLLARDLIYLAKNTKLREKIGKTSRNLVINKFSNNIILPKFEEIYLNL